MRNSLFHKFVSFVLLAVMLTFATAGFSHGACAEDSPGSSSVISANTVIPSIAAEKQGPVCPCDDHSTDSGHCGISCQCPCHASLTPQPVQVGCSPQISPLLFFEPFKALPEVYLSKFIPPQNLA
ncbi:MAG: hypothetical protein NDI77_16245 [Geobacteraceae bacterium]|nr:hypothetical protein [Geobacteraceae bacterium]